MTMALCQMKHPSILAVTINAQLSIIIINFKNTSHAMSNHVLPPIFILDLQ